MPVQKAVDAYTKEKLNCAQSIVKGFNKIIPAEVMVEAARKGHGRAPNGVCGAVHAATMLAEKEHKQDILDNFVKQAGSEFCRGIREIGQLPCHKCVELSASLLADTLTK